MGKLRDKLNRVNAPRPTELPSGATSVVSEAPPPEQETAPVALTKGGRRTFQLQESARGAAVSEASQEELEAETEQIPRFRGVLTPVDSYESKSKSTPARRSSPPADAESKRQEESSTAEAGRPPTRRDALDSPHRRALKRGRAESESVFRARDFKRWRKERTAPAMEAVRESATPTPAPEDLILERAEGPPVASEDYLRAARIEVSRGRVAAARQHLRRARELPMPPAVKWSATRMLAELLVDEGADDEARPLLEELCASEHGDPYPLVVLSEMLATEDPPRSAELRAAAKRIAPWLR